MHACRIGSRGAQAARLRSVQCDEGAMHAALPASLQLTSNRGVKLFEIFSKQARTERRRKLKEDMQHGYFDDFRAVRDKQGKIFSSPDRLLDSQVAQTFPPTQVVRPNGEEVMLPPPPGQYKAALLCTAFRAGAEDMLASWSQPFRERFGAQHGAHYYELSFVESAVMSVWPFKQMILKAQLRQGPAPAAKSTNPTSGDQAISSTTSQSSVSHQSSSSAQPMPTLGPQELVQQKLSHDDSPAQSAAEPALQSRPDSAADPDWSLKFGSAQHQESPGSKGQSSKQANQALAGVTGNAPVDFLHTDYLFHFGDTTEIRKALEMPNRLTGYAFLVDSSGLVRWRGSGKAEAAEVDSLLQAADQLLR